MAVSSGTASCPSNVATAIVAAANSNANAAGFSQGSRTVILFNVGSWDCYIGGSGVDSTNFRLKANSTIGPLALGPADALYGKAVQNTASINYIVTG